MSIMTVISRTPWTGSTRAFYDTRPMKRKHPDWYRDDLARPFGLLAAGGLQPVIAGHLLLDEAVTAHRMLEDRGVQGRLVLTPNPDWTGLFLPRVSSWADPIRRQGECGIDPD